MGRARNDERCSTALSMLLRDSRRVNNENVCDERYAAKHKKYMFSGGLRELTVDSCGLLR